VFTAADDPKVVRKADLPASYEGFLDPKWRGKLTIEADDNNWLMAVTSALGEERAVKLLRELVAKNGISVRKGHSLTEGAAATTLIGQDAAQLGSAARRALDVAASGDLAYTIGGDTGCKACGSYFRIWRWNDQRWRLVVDLEKP
jgi:ABC-type Fe3+ transport system substrate-binding protein